MIRVENLVFDYPRQRALNGVSLHIRSGTVTALVGPNGAGKSTLLRCLAGLETPLAGRMAIAGVEVQEHPRLAHQKLGYLSDFYGLYQDLTVAQCLTYAAASQGLLPQQVAQRVRQVAQQLELTHKLDAPAGQLSRGQRQRVAIGQALAHAPQVLLLDEPASGLDPEARGSLSKLFRQLHASGMTLVVSSHILSELDEYCTHILSIRDGRITRHASLDSGASAHAASASDADGQTETGMQIQIAAPVPHLAGVLAAYKVLHLDASAQGSTTVALPAHDAQARVDLLAHLVCAGVPVMAYAPVRASLRESYAQSLQAPSSQASADDVEHTGSMA